MTTHTTRDPQAVHSNVMTTPLTVAAIAAALVVTFTLWAACRTGRRPTPTHPSTKQQGGNNEGGPQ